MVTAVLNSIKMRHWALLSVIAVAASISTVDWTSATHAGAGASMRMFVNALITPDISSTTLITAGNAAWITVAYAAAAMSIAIAVGIPLGLIASGTLLSSGISNTTLMISVRAYLGFIRSIHELIWALLLVASFGLSPVVGVLAIAVPYSGIIGRVFAERLQDVPMHQLAAFESTGASSLQMVIGARIPSTLPDITSYLFYRFECAIRTAAVLSFVGLGGIGFQIHIALSDLKFETVATLMYTLVILIVVIDVFSGFVRKRMIA
jgi:phosphonate transport system permease protein